MFITEVWRINFRPVRYQRLCSVLIFWSLRGKPVTLETHTHTQYNEPSPSSQLSSFLLVYMTLTTTMCVFQHHKDEL